MASPPSRGTGNAFAFGSMGAVIGAALGALVWYGALSPGQQLQNNPDPMAQSMAKILGPIDACFAIMSLLVGAGIGASVGVVIGVVRRPRSPESTVPAPTTTSSEEEAARLKAEIARLEKKLDDLQGNEKPPDHEGT